MWFVILIVWITVHFNNTFNTLDKKIAIIEAQTAIYQSAIDNGVGYYHPKTGKFTWKTEIEK
jgi:hypothetical protein